MDINTFCSNCVMILTTFLKLCNIFYKAFLMDVSIMLNLLGILKMLILQTFKLTKARVIAKYHWLCKCTDRTYTRKLAKLQIEIREIKSSPIKTGTQTGESGMQAFNGRERHDCQLLWPIDNRLIRILSIITRQYN